MKLFTICICTFNGEAFLEQQLNSIVAQTYFHLVENIVVCDDTSTDDTINTLMSYKKKFAEFQIVLNKNRLGPLKNFEKALSLAKSEYVVLCDQDDIWHPLKLEFLYKSIQQNPRSQLFAHDATIINENNELLELSFMVKFKGCFSSTLLSNFISNKYLGCTMAIKSSLLKYALPIPSCSPQHDIWLGIFGSITKSTMYIDESLIFYRTHRKNESPASKNRSGSLLAILILRVRFLLCAFIAHLRCYPFSKIAIN